MKRWSLFHVSVWTLLSTVTMVSASFNFSTRREMEFEEGVHPKVIDVTAPHDPGMTFVTVPLLNCGASGWYWRQGLSVALFPLESEASAEVWYRHSLDALHWSDWKSLPHTPSAEAGGGYGFFDDQYGEPDLTEALLFDTFIESEGPTPAWREAAAEWRESERPLIPYTYHFCQWLAENRRDILEENTDGRAYWQFRIESHQPVMTFERIAWATSECHGGEEPEDDPEKAEMIRSMRHRSWDFLYPGIASDDGELHYRERLGDVDGDGKRDVKDLVALINHLKHIRHITDPVSLGWADANVDGMIDQADVARLIHLLITHEH